MAINKTTCHCGCGKSDLRDGKESDAKLTVALIGNQNCGKTTLFNALTGANQYVGNWPGVTVDRVIGRTLQQPWDVVDLPGLYSLSPYSAEEIVSRNFLLSDSFDVILNVLDATHLERSLSLTLELLPLGKPMVVALNMMDLLKKDRNVTLDPAKIAAKLGVEVIPISASSGEGLKELYSALGRARQRTQSNPAVPQNVHDAIDAIGALLGDQTPAQRYFIAKALLQQDKVYAEEYLTVPGVEEAVQKGRSLIAKEHGLDAEAFFPQMRYAFIDSLMVEALSRSSKPLSAVFSEKIDQVVTNRFWALPVFLAVIYVIYYLAVSTIGTWSTDFANDVVFGEWCTEAAESVLESLGAPEWVSSMMIEGLIGGVGAVLGFVPQMMVLFFLLSILEQCGYMTRVAFVLDRLFRKFGLSGRSFIPILIATGCAVPALMATKTLDNINERRLTLLTASYLPCSAKLPIMTMIFVSFFPDSVYIAPLIYLLGIFSIVCTGIILKKNSAFKEEVSPFVMELPDYHLPSVRNLLLTVYERCKAFIVKAGTVIFGTVMVVWFLSRFGFGPEGFGMVEISDSMLAAIGTSIAFIFAPLGFGTWQAAVAVITGLMAKENVVGTLAVLLEVGEDVAEDDATLSAAIQGAFPGALAAFAFLAFNLWSTPCIAALAAMKRQYVSGRWFAFAVCYMLLWAYSLALVIYQLGGMLTGAVPFSIFTIIALVVLGAFLYLLFRPDRTNGVPLVIPARTVS
ncbi:MAG: ferrous iron transport protein B [Succinivibrio sp.]|nr:ferrous iron transport protein B [Succinivibrio sp.]